jgi:hypothetical protein
MEIRRLQREHELNTTGGINGTNLTAAFHRRDQNCLPVDTRISERIIEMDIKMGVFSIGVRTPTENSRYLTGRTTEPTSSCSLFLSSGSRWHEFSTVCSPSIRLRFR